MVDSAVLAVNALVSIVTWITAITFFRPMQITMYPEHSCVENITNHSN